MRLIPALTLGLTLAALAACGGGEAGPAAEDGDGIRRRTFTFPHVLTADHPVHKGIVRFAEQLEQLSDGRMTVRIFEGGTMGSEQELVDNVASGTSDFTKTATTILETKSELAQVYSLPYLFNDDEHLWHVLDGEIGRELLDMAEPAGLKGLCYYAAGFRSFYTKRTPVNSPADLDGLKIRVQKSEMMTRLMSTLGALPQPIAWGELYTALDTGVVDGAENNIPSYYNEQHYKVAPYYSFDRHVGVPDLMLVSTQTWEGLSEAERAVIKQAAAASSAYQRELWDAAVAENIAAMKAEGVAFIEPDQAPFKAKTAPMYEGLSPEVAAYVERIRAEGSATAP